MTPGEVERAVTPESAVTGWGALLASLPNMGPQRLLALLRHHPIEHIADVVMGNRPAIGLAATVLAEPGLRSSWANVLRRSSVEEAAERCRNAGAWVCVWGQPG